MKTIKLDIVSAEQKLYSGDIASAQAMLVLGEVGIFPGHTPLLSPLKPGELAVTHQDGSIESFYISGGIIEVQPEQITILADTAARAETLDQAAAMKAEKAAREKLSNSSSKADYFTALKEINAAAVQIRMTKDLK